jgi:ABC-type Fe3+/spermidine/putrescine transport system ATPase subunit
VPSVELKGVTVKYGRKKALDDIDLSIESGSYAIVAGPTGAGKTTLLKAICGLVPLAKGKIIVDGEDITEVPPENRGIGYLPQGYALFPHLDVWGNVTFGPVSRGWEIKDVEVIARRILNMIGLIERADAYPHELSGGMAQRVALGRAIASGADLILLDEPLSALDVMLRIMLRYEIKKMAKALNLTVIHVTHDQEEAMSIGDRIFLLREGRILEEGSPEELFKSPENPFTAYFIGESNFYIGHAKDGAVKLNDLELQSKSKLTGDVLVAIRTRNVRISLAEKRAPRSVSAVVEEVRFLGKMTKLLLSINDLKIMSEMPTLKIRGIEVGDPVFLSIDPEDVLLYELEALEAYPEIKEVVLNA